jgi:hypothetical protein
LLIKKRLVRRVSKGSNLTGEPSVYRTYPVADKEADFPTMTEEQIESFLG